MLNVCLEGSKEGRKREETIMLYNRHLMSAWKERRKERRKNRKQ